jgi:hypothetical protein
MPVEIHEAFEKKIYDSTEMQESRWLRKIQSSLDEERN